MRAIRRRVSLRGQLLRYGEIYAEKKREKGLLDFNDIEHDAYEILKDAEAAAFYREKFLHIFVDEYQDSNVIQEALIERLQSGRQPVYGRRHQAEHLYVPIGRAGDFPRALSAI